VIVTYIIGHKQWLLRKGTGSEGLEVVWTLWCNGSTLETDQSPFAWHVVLGR